MKRLLRYAPSLLLLLHLLPPMAIRLLEQCGYIILRRSDAWWSWILAALTAVAAVLSLVFKPEWNKSNRIAAALLLPLGCMLDIDFAAGRYMNAWLPALVCALFDIVLFIRSKLRAILKLPLALFACLGILFLFFASFISIGNITVRSAVSPDEKHIAFIECIDEGALGGRVLGYACEYHPDSLLDSFFRKGKLVMDHGFLPPDEITLFWKDSNTLVMNKITHRIDDLFK